MEYNYDPYIQITGTTRFPPLRSSSFIRCCKMESLFQRENCYKENDTRQNNRIGRLKAGGGRGGGEVGRDRCGGSCRSPIIALNQDASRVFHERYSSLTPAAFCLTGPDGSKSLCLNQEEYEAIVERSRNKNSDFSVVFCPLSTTDDQNLDDVCSSQRTTPTTESQCRRPSRTHRRPPSPPFLRHRPSPSMCGGRGGKQGRAAGATKKKAAVSRTKDEQKNCSKCLRGSCGRPLKCSSQTSDKRENKLRNKGRQLPPVGNPCHSSKINQPSGGCGCCSCSSDVRHRMNSDCGKGFTESSCRSTAADSAARISRSKGCCCRCRSSNDQANLDNLTPPHCRSDRTRLRPNNLDACDVGKLARGCNIYHVKPFDCAKIESTGVCSAGETTFYLSAM